MSSPATAFRVFYPDTNTVNAVSLFDATGAALTPQTLTDGVGVKTYAVKAPGSPVALVKALGKDPITGELRLGNDLLVRWSGEVPTRAEVEADIEDITDPQGYLPFALINRTTYAESSVGLSLVQVDSQIVPQDGLTHQENPICHWITGDECRKTGMDPG